MLNPFIDLIAQGIRLYNIAIMIWFVLGLLIQFQVINRYNPLVQRVEIFLNGLIEPALAPIRRFIRKILPNLSGFDISPIILILLLNFATNALYTYFYSVPLPVAG